MDEGQRCKKSETRYGYDPELDDCVYYQYGGSLLSQYSSFVMAVR